MAPKIVDVKFLKQEGSRGSQPSWSALSKLEDDIRIMLNDGWVMEGGLIVEGYTIDANKRMLFIQKMVKYEGEVMTVGRKKPIGF